MGAIPTAVLTFMSMSSSFAHAKEVDKVQNREKVRAGRMETGPFDGRG
jgi:hypothetical protein